MIIIDDGSTDTSLSVARELLANETRAKIITQENAGVSAARNNGANEATHDYIAFLDADDLWHPNYLEIMAAEIAQKPTTNWFGAKYKPFTGKVEYSNPEISNIRFNMYNYFEHSVEVKRTTLDEDISSLVHSDSFIIKKKAFWDAGAFPIGMKYNEDFCFFSNVALNEKICWTSEALTYYRLDAENQVSRSITTQKAPPFILKRVKSKDVHEANFMGMLLIGWISYLLKHAIQREKGSLLTPLKYSFILLNSPQYRISALFLCIPLSLLYAVSPRLFFTIWQFYLKTKNRSQS